MSDVEIPKRALFKPSEVCELASVQAYVLRSWESEFPDLGVARSEGGPRLYRRADVERVLRIKQLVFADGLTLAGVRRRIESEKTPLLTEADEVPFRELLGRNAGERLSAVKTGLQAILAMLSDAPGASAMSATVKARPTAIRQVSPSPVRPAAAPKRKSSVQPRGRKPALKPPQKRARGR